MVMDIFRLTDGMVVEHWDCVQDVPAHSPESHFNVLGVSPCFGLPWSYCSRCWSSWCSAFWWAAPARAYKIQAPATSGHPVFERAFRVHYNTLEMIVVFIPAIWLFGLY